ncbi:MAG TPA: EAL domain-containing protein [Vicinamibacteria bacterium]|jgi:EAL domain-containing protein (putative c-di-GMP-specific phosphodiesterase class I)
MSQAQSQETRATRWCLESLVDGGKSLQRIPIVTVPFRIGRVVGLELTLPFQSVSKRHAEIYCEGDGLVLRDLDSTNGTFVNRKRVKEASLHEGDILHFAEFEFRVGRHSSDGAVVDEATLDRGTLALRRLELPQQFVAGTRQLAELLERGLTAPVFQPIVSLPGGAVEAFEVLGRGTHPELPSAPKELFRIAETMGREAELSRLFRRRAVEVLIERRAKLPFLFLNTHPSELGHPELVESLRELRRIGRDLDLVVEIHEGALAEPQVIAELKQELDSLSMRLALDDFGLGERILQLAEVPPHYLKFDISMVKDIVKAPASKRRLLAMLMAAAREVSALPIAEGIENETEASVCTSAGFTLAQGYLFGVPLPITDLKKTDGRD